MFRFLIAAAVLAASAHAQPASELNFVAGLNDYKALRRMLPEWLDAKAEEYLAKRKAAIHGITDLAGLKARQQHIRKRMLEMLGGFPDRTPLNARVVGTLDREGYQIEKIIFESQPGFFVTANLYLPARGQGPFPAVLFPLGHEPGAKAYPVWQQILATLARKGYVALTWDPLGQGERIQFYDEDWKGSKLQSSTVEHTELGIQCLLVGDHIARYTIWDGIRALDYLLSRKEVDAKRVACTGNSGGGTHTAYISALDDRIGVAAPSCYISSWRRMLTGLGPQDAEQVFPNWIGDGFDYPDFVYAFGPKPYLLLPAIRDFFPIEGARETFEEVKAVFSRAGVGERVSIVEADDGHGYTAPRRAAAYAWLGRWLNADAGPETEIRPELASDLQCTETGQVSGETVFSLNRQRAAALRRSGQAVEQARLRSGFAPQKDAVPVKSYGSIARQGYRIEKLVYESEPGISVPALLWLPESGPARKPGIVVVDGAGKAASSAEQFVKEGMVVLSIDARGLGETRPELEPRSEFVRYFGDYDSGMTALLIGKTLAGMRAEDIVRGIDLLAARPEVDAARLSAYGKQAGAVPLLYAAAFDGRLRAVALDRMLVSYSAVVDQRIHRNVFEHVVPGALRDFDLPDLAAALAPRPVWLIDAVDPLGNPLRAAAVRRAYPRAEIRETRPEESAAGLLGEFIRAQR